VSYTTLNVQLRDGVCFLQLHRPDANNTINDRLVAECHSVLAACEQGDVVAVVVSGLPDVFCFGADFRTLDGGRPDVPRQELSGSLYDLWLRLCEGPFVSIAHVRGAANAGGVGFVAASDIVIADESARFSLSELLFGLNPACVLPFLVRRVGFQRAHYMALTTQPVGAKQAQAWGLIDACEDQSEALLRRHLVRLRRLSRTAIRRYKTYARTIHQALSDCRQNALAANAEVFSDAANLEGIRRYVESGLFPWESQ
jgi:polyketide biosynthesis enoyl-CoA hydratase PksH